MIILFEEFAYDRDVVVQNVSGLRLKRLKENKASIPYVGYYYSSEIGDSVFILPKVFINVRKDENGKNVEKAFGSFDPMEIINTNDKNNALLGSKFYMNVFNLSTWIYRAIERYKERNGTEDITEPVNVLSVDSANGDKSQTQINIILDLIRFNKEHQNLFTFIARLSSQGHHRVNWQKTISKRMPFTQDDAPIYMEPISYTKVINPDEELIVLFFSVMDYLHAKYHFRVIRNVNFVTFPKDVEKLIQSGKGTRLLKKIRHKYYKDDLVKTINVFSKIEPIKALLFSNSVFYEENQNITCFRDSLWEYSTHGVNPHNIGGYDVDFKDIDDLQAYLESLNIYCVMRDGAYINFPSMNLLDYFKQEYVSGEIYCNGEYRNIDIIPCVDDIKYLRPFKFINLTFRGTVEFRSICTQPIRDSMCVAAFHLGLKDKLDELEYIINNDEVIYHKGYTAGELRRLLIKYEIPSFIDNKDICRLSKDIVDLARDGLKERGIGEEIFLKSLYDRIKKHTNPGKDFITSMNNGIKLENIIEDYGKLDLY